MVLLPKKHRTHYSRPKRCSQKVLQTRLLYTFPLKMHQYFKYSNSLHFPFDRCCRVASGLLISEVKAFLQKPSSVIIILIFVNRTLRRIRSSRLIIIGITCCCMSKFLSNLVLSRSIQCFGCGLDQSNYMWLGLTRVKVKI